MTVNLTGKTCGPWKVLERVSAKAWMCLHRDGRRVAVAEESLLALRAIEARVEAERLASRWAHLVHALQAEERRRERLQKEVAEAKEAEALLRARKAAKVFTRTQGEDLVGRTVNGWQVKGYVGPSAASPLWLVRHACGHKRVIAGCRLRHKPPRCRKCGER